MVVLVTTCARTRGGNDDDDDKSLGGALGGLDDGRFDDMGLGGWREGEGVVEMGLGKCTRQSSIFLFL